VTALDLVRGRVLDVDSHEMVSVPLLEQEFGEIASLLGAMYERWPDESMHGVTFRSTTVDDVAIDPDTIWELNGAPAPSAIDMRRRPAVLDAMGIRQQLIFPTAVGLTGLIMAAGGIEQLSRMFVRDGPLGRLDPREVGLALCTGHNDWCIRTQALDDRLRPVAVIDTTSIPEAIAEARRVIAAGVKCVLVPSDVPPGGQSPAHEGFDEFWELCAEADVPVVLHLGSEWNFVRDRGAWVAGVPTFRTRNETLREADLNPHHFSTVHFAAQNYLTTMLLGGVFERHPRLRFGVIELTAHWVGPMAENLTLWLEQFRSRGKELSLSPSEYLQRNVRVGSFYWEPVDEYIERHGLDDVYAYSSDFPHVESGALNSIEVLADRLERLGPSVVEKFFVSNGQLLFP
jgi:predicted TIM-barrel fold metal-dependent hydrolase